MSGEPRAAAGLATVRDVLVGRFAGRYAEGAAVREQHCQSLGWLPRQPPDAVVTVEDRDEVEFLVGICARERIPLIPFGAGSSLEGQTNAPRGGICVDLSSMRAVLDIDPENMVARVQPGVTRLQLDRRLRAEGCFFPVDPGADATLGGMASTRASGTTTVRYGTMRENVLAVEAVLADGRVLRTGTGARKSSAGYDLVHLFVGAEGTLGVITELTLRIHPVPPAIVSGVCPFPSVDAAVRAVIQARQLDVGLARIELLDELSVRASNRYSGLTLAPSPHLFVEFHGSAEAVEQHASTFAGIVEECGGGPLVWRTRPAQRNALWKARHDAWWALHALRPGWVGIPTDVCVPISRLDTCIAETQRDAVASRLDAPLIGHVGDGNFHLLLLVDPADAELLGRARDFATRLGRRAIELGGTCTGEHGVGQGKLDLAAHEHGVGADVMRAIKTALDPDGIMNPGKIFVS